jgi:phage-related protein
MAAQALLAIAPELISIIGAVAGASGGGGKGGGGGGSGSAANLASSLGGGGGSGGGGGGLFSGIAGAISPMQMLGSVASKLSAPFHKLSEAMSTLEAPAKAAEAFFQQVAEYVGKFNPATVQLFQLAVDDFKASVGEILVPILQFGTKLFRQMGDAVASVATPVRKLISFFTEGFSKVFGDLFQHFSTVLDIFNAVVDLFRALLVAVKPFRDMIWSIFNVFMSLFDPIKELIALFFDIGRVMLEIAREENPFNSIFSGIKEFFDSISSYLKELTEKVRAIRRIFGGSIADKSSVGKSATQTQTQSVTDYLSKTQQNAFSIGSSAKPEEKSANYLADLKEYFIDGKFLSEIIQAVKNIPKQAQEAVIDRAKSIASRAAGFDVNMAWEIIKSRGQ